ncbi:MAG: rod shape-determining protein RodA [Alphaproteobacteria bacterium]
MTLLQKLGQFNWPLLALVLAVIGIGVAALFSAGGGGWSPYANRQVMRVGLGLAVLMVIALIDLKFWLKMSPLIWLGGVCLLIVVEFFGHTGMGATRWIDLHFMKLQPSELMKIAVILALARYYHGLSAEEVPKLHWLIPPALIIGVPMALVLRQPDLGTALMIGMVGASMIFLSGIRWWQIASVGTLAGIALPFAWARLHDYQKQRVLTFMNPEEDPTGAGYHIVQSKIALGSGGVEGKGFLKGTQIQLDFLPEAHTDFIFALWSEEWGFVGAVALIGLFLAICAYGYLIALTSRSQFGRLLALGLTVNLFLYMFINMAMVMGLLPVVGVPLAMVSYGGTVMLTSLAGIGLMICVFIHRHTDLTRRSAYFRR